MADFLLHELAADGNWKQLETLFRVKEVQDVNLKDEEFGGNTPLHWAVRKACLNEFRKLEQQMFFVGIKKMNINYQDDDFGSRTALHIASHKGHVRCCKILLDHGADPSLRMYQGWTPAHCAAEIGNLEIIKMLFEASGNLIAKDDYGATPKHIARVYGHEQIVEFLDTVENNPSQRPLFAKDRMVNAARRTLINQMREREKDDNT